MTSISRDSAACGPSWVELLSPYALPDWELVHAPRGAGHWLCTHAPSGPIALAAPGVALDPGAGEALEQWRCGAWLLRDLEDEHVDIRGPDRVVELPLVGVVRLAGDDWTPWLRRVTATLIERTYAFGFVGTSAAPPREGRARDTQVVYETLLAEAREAFPDLDVRGMRGERIAMPRRMPRTVRAFQHRFERRNVLQRLLRRALRTIGRGPHRIGDGAEAPEPARLLS